MPLDRNAMIGHPSIVAKQQAFVEDGLYMSIDSAPLAPPKLKPP